MTDSSEELDRISRLLSPLEREGADGDDDGVDKESAAAAVALIVASARKGLVALCSSVAQILKDKACLEKEIGRLRVELHSRTSYNDEQRPAVQQEAPASSRSTSASVHVEMHRHKECPRANKEDGERRPTQPKIPVSRRRSTSLNNDVGRSANHMVLVHSPPASSTAKRVKADRQQNPLKAKYEGGLSRLESSEDFHRSQVLCPSPLAGCKCSECSMQSAREIDRCGSRAQMFLLTDDRHNGRPILRINNLVCLPGDLIGIVRYLGHLDGAGHRFAVFVGVELGEPKGDTDGKLHKTSYFVCRMDYGVFVPLHEVLFVVGQVSANNCYLKNMSA